MGTVTEKAENAVLRGGGVLAPFPGLFSLG